ncbi:hypothetical protein E3N88_08646 [Mikania micrantha]|uniref:PB1-like domain-containing protein n=1 Tax=Mikania micrantha TaxID=192012 RepID=A0A5N6PGS5_9ASTR|nr:hypothetical protein E3N88_08646 [Mikania micrantha]
MKLWFVRDPYERVDPQQFYGENSSIFSLKFNHGGIFTKVPDRKYVSGKVNYIDMVDSDNFSMHELNEMIQELGYTKDFFMYYHFRVPDGDLDTGIKALGDANDVCNLLKYVDRNKVIDIYTQQAPHGSRFLNKKLSESGSSSPLSVDDDQHLFDDEQTESDDEDYLVDEEDLVHDVEVDMDDFRALVVMEELDDETFDDNEKINVDHDDFDSLSDEDNDPPLKRMTKKARNDHKDSIAMPFYVGQSFNNRDVIRALVIKHALESRRQLFIQMNDPKRFRVVCLGKSPIFEQGVGKRNQVPTCPWTLHISNQFQEDSWVVKTFIDDHVCLQTREVKLFTISYIAKEIQSIIEANPSIPLRALQDLLQKKTSIISKCDGPLTPTATRLFNSIKAKASDYTVLWNAVDKYQRTLDPISLPYNLTASKTSQASRKTKEEEKHD